MNSAKIGVGVLTALTVGVVAYVFFLRDFIAPPTAIEPTYTSSEDLNPPGRGQPVVAIITQNTVAENVNFAPIDDSEDSESQAENANDTAKKLMSGTMDYMAGNLAKTLRQTGRLQVIENIRIQSVLSDVSGTSVDTDEGSEQEDSSDVIIEPAEDTDIWDLISALAPEPSAPPVSEEEREEAADEFTNTVERIGADFVLVVYVAKPNYETFSRKVPDTTRVVHTLLASPTISYRLFDAKLGTVLIADVTQPSEPLRFDFDANSIPEQSEIVREVVELDERIAREIVTNIVDTLFPAQIGLFDPGDPGILVFDRGRRDGIQVGDVFEVTRPIGEVVGANGYSLMEQARSMEGTVRVTRTQQTLSFVEAETGGPFVQGDFIELIGSDYDRRRKERRGSDSSSSTGIAPTPVANAPALGIDMIRTEEAGVPDNRPRITVREVAVSYIDCSSCGAADPGNALLPQALLNELRDEDRIAVVSREDMEALIQERNFADSAAGRNMRLGVEGMTSAHYVLSGEATVAPRTQVFTERVAGRERESGRQTTLRVSGNFRILNAETADLVQSTQVEFTMSGGTTQSNLQRAANRVAAEATADLMNQLFPLAVLRVVSNDQIELSSGRQAGLENGMRLQAYSMGDEIQDLYRGRSEAGRIATGQLIVTDVRSDRATAKFAAQPFDLKTGDQLEIAARASTPRAAPARASSSTSAPAAPQPNQSTPDPSEDLDDF